MLIKSSTEIQLPGGENRKFVTMFMVCFEINYLLSTKVFVVFSLLPVAKKRGKIVSFLRLFLSSRPSKARLLQTGILK